MTRLVLGLLRPYRGWLAIVFIAMLVEIATSLAAPWPLKLVLDDALGKHHLPHWLAWAHDYGFGRHTLGVALFAGAATLVLRSSVRLRRRECPSQQLRGWESEDGQIGGRAETAEKLIPAFEKAGVVFIAENGGGAGVRLRRRGV